jgi:PST family polysaccharide transporter
LLGPAGVGLFGLYSSIADLAQSIAGLGINSSGVRQIAHAVGSGDSEEIARTTVVLKRVALISGVLGAGLLASFSKQISVLTFGTSEHRYAVALLSIAVFLRLVSAGQGALIQGLRRIADLAKMGVLGALFGTLFSVVMVYVWGAKGIVPSLVAVGGMTILTSWWYSRRVVVEKPSLTMAQIGAETRSLLKLGFAFMASSMSAMGAAYAVRTVVLRQAGPEATGMYQAAWTLAGLYVGIILQAMGADFYPRLTAKANDNAACNQLVNEQGRIGLLLAGPGVIATLTFAPVVISVFYSGRFDGAVGILRWLCLGATLQVLSWPMGFILMANGRQNLVFLSELAWAIVYAGLAWFCISRFGVNGAGMAFFGSYVFHYVFTYEIVKRLNNFRWFPASLDTAARFLLMIAGVFGAFYALPAIWATCIGTVVFIEAGRYSLRTVFYLAPVEQIPGPIRRLAAVFHLLPACINE